MKSRRQVLKSVAVLPVLPIEAAQTQPKARFFLPEESKLITVLVDLLIPRTETPGASDAGVPAFIDRTLSSRKDRQQEFRDGLAKLEEESRKRFGASLLDLKPKDQAAILQDMATRRDPFFKLIKDLTIDGYYSSKEGLVDELGWHGQTMLAEFKGCTHPEHKA